MSSTPRDLPRALVRHETTSWLLHHDLDPDQQWVVLLSWYSHSGGPAILRQSASRRGAEALARVINTACDVHHTQGKKDAYDIMNERLDAEAEALADRDYALIDTYEQLFFDRADEQRWQEQR